MRRSLLLVALTVVAISASAADSVLFPKPLHLTREIADPVSGRTARVEQYCLANRVVSIAGSRTVIADYDRSELTEIDREHGTYSVTPFAAVASARPRRRTAMRMSANAATPIAAPTVAHKGTDHRAGRNVDLVAADDAAHALHADVAVDQGAELSRDAFDVLAGAAYPNEGDASTELLRNAARRANGANAGEKYGLPIEQVLRWEIDGATLTATNKVTQVKDDVAPPDLIAIPPGARRVDSHIVVTARESEQIDALPGKPRP